MRHFFVTLVVVGVVVVGPAMMNGASRSVLAANRSSQSVQNARADEYHLARMRNRAMIQRFYEAGYLVSVPPETRFYYLRDIPSAYCYLRPWAKRFLDQLGRQFYANFHEPLRVTSLIRTVALQRRLVHTNYNAADATGLDRSSHLTGATLDISKHAMTWREKRWMRQRLIELQKNGYLYAVEEFEQPCFHVMVFPNYRDYAPKPEGHSLEANRAN